MKSSPARKLAMFAVVALIVAVGALLLGARSGNALLVVSGTIILLALAVMGAAIFFKTRKG
ncbi:hypothetical protein ACIQKE_12560 [Streptomyces griseoviridis]|uniref:Uncharacterized protein n=2 Tax=Streptomyces TaxID=1883 RepID=A0A3S9Z5A1_STRGD|nr:MULTISPECIES: hypothetical protein [Streptomyces]AZS82878.1 hypothetical protein ELQ87_00110 [Streptomyces griseoviridis]MDH6695561.1 putative membrane-anchored protein [Streptomyces sp. MAA16]MDT0470799.1 hypothetical protein [Streptomyces sp. DSM 41014]